MMTGFGMEGVSPFITKPPIMEQEQPDSGKGGILGMITKILSLGALIPGPQQPFLSGAANLGGVVTGATTGDYGAMASGIKGMAQNNPFAGGQQEQPPQSVTDSSAEQLQALAQQWMTMASQENDPESQSINPWDMLNNSGYPWRY